MIRGEAHPRWPKTINNTKTKCTRYIVQTPSDFDLRERMMCTTGTYYYCFAIFPCRVDGTSRPRTTRPRIPYATLFCVGCVTLYLVIHNDIFV